VKRHLKGWVVFGLLGVLLAGCATGPAFAPDPPSPGRVRVYVFRTHSPVGAANSDLVAVNGRFVARLNSGTWAVHETEVGRVEVTRRVASSLGWGQSLGWGLGALVGLVDGFRPLVSFEGEAGGIYFVRLPHGKAVTREVAVRKMRGLRDVTPTESDSSGADEATSD